MEERKTILTAIFAVLILTAIFGGVILALKNMTPTGLYTASTAFINYEPVEMCELNGCEYIASTVSMPTVLSTQQPTVDCYCNGYIRTFMLRQPNRGIYNPDYYP